MATWQSHDAKARFSELLEMTLKKGPQIVTLRGIEAAVVVSVKEWNRLKIAARPSAKQLLLGPGPRFDLPIPKRGTLRRRKPLRLK